MTRNEYKTILLANGFIFDHTQMGFPGRGEEDVYKHPKFKYKFYVTRISIEDVSMYGFITAKTNGEYLNGIYPQNTEDTFNSNKILYVWKDEGFTELMERFEA